MIAYLEWTDVTFGQTVVQTISTTTCQISTQFAIIINATQIINPNDFGHALTFSSGPQSC